MRATWAGCTGSASTRGGSRLSALAFSRTGGRRALFPALVSLLAALALLGAAAPAFARAGHWSLMRVTVARQPLPGTEPPGALTGTSCPVAGTCIAVGADIPAGSHAQVGVAEEWNGSTWTTLPTPAAFPSLDSVSCSSATACMAVGDNGAGSSNTPVAEQWNGSTWTAETIPALGVGDASGATLTGISCTAANACVAVGSAGDSGDSAVWNGASWTAEPTGSGSLSVVSCVSASDCEAVGAGPGPSSVAELWNGSSWSPQTVPSPSRFPGAGGTSPTPPTGTPITASLSDVSCVSASACVAVGSDSDGWTQGNGQPYEEPEVAMWNGTAWSLAALPAAVLADLASLQAVSCTSAAACTEIGIDQNNALEAVSSNGTSFSAPTYAAAGDSTSGVPCFLDGACLADVSAISCTAAGGCLAVGSGPPQADPAGAEPTAEVSSGADWVDVSPRLGSGTGAIAGSGFTGVSCSSPGRCTAVGQDGGALVERLRGGAWSLQRMAPAGATELAPLAVSCPSSSDCEAVGDTVDPSGQVSPLAERWNGTGWSLQSTALAQASSPLVAISCGAVARCLAVGSWLDQGYFTSGLSESLAVGSWSLDAVPGAAGGPYFIADEDDGTAPDGMLTGVSCPAGASCVAVGSFYQSANSGSNAIDDNVALRWNGSALSPLVPEPRDAATAVSCPTAARCMTVAAGASAQLYDGRAWRTLTIPGAQGASLGQVSCVNARTCTLAGTDRDRVAIWRWHDGTFTRQPVPSPRRAVFVSVDGLSCPAARTCVAVGTYTVRGGGRFPLVERYR
jgi:hypothetical protein